MLARPANKNLCNKFMKFMKLNKDSWTCNKPHRDWPLILLFPEPTHYKVVFVKKQSTIKSVFNMVYDVCLAKNERKYSLAVYLDICKAFDCVNHKLLLQKLEEIGIGGKCKDWLCNFLTE